VYFKFWFGAGLQPGSSALGFSFGVRLLMYLLSFHCSHKLSLLLGCMWLAS